MRKVDGRRSKKALEVLLRLEQSYGIAEPHPRTDPTDELVACILSQHTSDANSVPAFEKLKKTFPSWEEVLAAGPDAVADVVRAAGLANQKSRAIIRCLVTIEAETHGFSLDFLGSLDPLDAREWLMRLPGVGPKTASLVLCFSLGMDVLPVDTHVFRVAWRIGFIKKALGEGKAHDALLAIVPENMSFRFHMALIQHGRAVCKAPVPRCDQCLISHLCAFFRQTRGRSSGAGNGARANVPDSK